MTTKPLRFVYADASGATTRRELSSWSENEGYIKGVQLIDSGRRTFRKDQIIEYLDTQEKWEESPHPLPEPGPSGWGSTAKQEQAKRLEIAFTGFSAALRSSLEQAATSANFQVRKDVTQNLSFLCAGPNAGPKKIEKALQMKIVIMDEDAFRWLLDTGEIPT